MGGGGWFAQSFSCKTQPLCCVGVGVLTKDPNIIEKLTSKHYIDLIFDTLHEGGASSYGMGYDDNLKN